MTYSRIAHHTAMVFDGNRNELYGNALRQLVHPQSVVLDLGAGLGVHGLLAAAAGASRVYLVDPQPVVHAAAQAARDAGLADRIVILQERIEDVDLPERVDLIVSVFTGNLLFSEDLLPSLFFARDRYLKPGGALLPDRAQLWLAPLSASDLHHKEIGRWSDAVMGLDYSGARGFAANEIMWLRRSEMAGSMQLAPGAAIAELDLVSATSGDCRGSASCKVEKSAMCHGLLGWIRIRLNGQWLSTAPDAPDVHWSPVLLPIDPPMPLEAGEDLAMSLARPAYGDWTWSLSARAGTRRHSSFLAKSDGPRDWARAAPANAPGLSVRGARAHKILERMAQGISNQDIASELIQSDGLHGNEALQEVQAMALRFGGRS